MACYSGKYPQSAGMLKSKSRSLRQARPSSLVSQSWSAARWLLPAAFCIFFLDSETLMGGGGTTDDASNGFIVSARHAGKWLGREVALAVLRDSLKDVLCNFLSPAQASGMEMSKTFSMEPFPKSPSMQRPVSSATLCMARSCCKGWLRFLKGWTPRRART